MMPEHWKRLTLGDVTESLDSRRVPVRARDRRPGAYPYWGASGIVDHVDRYLFDEPTLLVSEDGENLRTRKTPIAFLASGKYWVNNHAHVLRAKGASDLRFLTYHVGILSISGFITGSTQPKLTAAALARLPLLVPPIEEQRQIAAVLGALDDLIDTNRSFSIQTTDLAVALAQASPRRVPLSSVSRVVNPLQFRAEGLVDHYSIPIFDELRLPERVDGSTVKSSKLRIAAPSVLVSRLNPQTPRVWMAYPGDVPAAASTEFLALHANAKATVEEVWALCACEEFAAQMRSRVTGTTGSHQRVDKAAIPSLLVPDLAVIDPAARAAIVALVREAHASLLAARDATATRDELLPLLLSGRVQVNASESLAL